MAISAVSDANGTTLPRSGYFWGVQPPQYITSTIHGELHDLTEGSETPIGSWLEMQEPHTPSSLTPPYADQLLAFQWTFSDISVFHKTAAANLFLPAWTESTDSPWREFRRALAPLRSAADAVIEAISGPLGRVDSTPPQAGHAGLSAVARLVDVLGLSRPTVLRMAAVPESTFYAWQKNPTSVIRTPTIGRLLQLQAQVAILEEALGRDRTRSWLMAADRFEKLQGDEAEFAHVLNEAESALREAVRIIPRRRMRRADYAASSADDTKAGVPETAAWPGAAKWSNQEDSAH